eukprot:37204_1
MSTSNRKRQKRKKKKRQLEKIGHNNDPPSKKVKFIPHTLDNQATMSTKRRGRKRSLKEVSDKSSTQNIKRRRKNQMNETYMEIEQQKLSKSQHQKIKQISAPTQKPGPIDENIIQTTSISAPTQKPGPIDENSIQTTQRRKLNEETEKNETKQPIVINASKLKRKPSISAPTQKSSEQIFSTNDNERKREENVMDTNEQIIDEFRSKHWWYDWLICMLTELNKQNMRDAPPLFSIPFVANRNIRIILLCLLLCIYFYANKYILLLILLFLGTVCFRYKVGRIALSFLGSILASYISDWVQYFIVIIYGESYVHNSKLIQLIMLLVRWTNNNEMDEILCGFFVDVIIGAGEATLWECICSLFDTKYLLGLVVGITVYLKRNINEQKQKELLQKWSLPLMICFGILHWIEENKESKQ